MNNKLLDYYLAIERASRLMLDAARAEDWDGVVRGEGACAVLIEQLRFMAKTLQLSSEERLQKMRVMQQILHNDAEIRVLAEPWLSRFGQLFESNTHVTH